MTSEELRAAHGATIREQRKLRSMKQSELATMLGVTKTTISRYELGQVDVPTVQKIAIALVFGLSPDRLFPLEPTGTFANSA
jgi:transcriptional regulator with XRE-family HTH domain